MREADILEWISGNLSVRRVFGEPVERDGTTVVPVAMVIGGGGAGASGTSDAHDRESGGGFGLIARGIGVYTINAGQVRFVPATDRTVLAGIGLLVGARLLGRALRKRRS